MTPPVTLNELFLDAIAAHRGVPGALSFKREGTWTPITHDELHGRVRAVHAALRAAGIAPGDRVAILSENRPEWAIADYACLTSRAADVPVYPTLPAHQVAYILRDAGCRMAFCSTRAQLDKLLEIRGDLPALERIVTFDEGMSEPGVESFRAFEAAGREAQDRWPDWETEARQVRPDDLATIIYTSGTTGDPKGVMLSHGNITSNVVAVLEVINLRPIDSCLSFLPLSHIFERMVGHYLTLHGGVTIHYASSMDAVAAEMLEVRPSLMASVPRLYEKIYARVVEAAQGGGSLKRSIFEWAQATGEKILDYRLQDRRVPPALALGGAVADRLVFAKLRARTGGKLRLFVSGGAPLNPDICRFFLAAGLKILEGYGLTETSPVITVNPEERIKPGTVGPPIPGVEVRIADDGEVLCRGPNVMLGYYHKPEATAEAIDADGWFHTGDIGEIDADGYLRITDRKKDLIVTAGGKNIAPQPIEALLKTNEFVSNAVMIGDKRRFPSMLLVPNFERLRTWATHKGIPEMPPEALVERDDVREKIEREARKSLRDLAHYEAPKKFLILPRDFTIDGGELTPKLSIRRKIVEQKYHDQIEAMYADDGGRNDGTTEDRGD